jgi:predicted kinase
MPRSRLDASEFHNADRQEQLHHNPENYPAAPRSEDSLAPLCREEASSCGRPISHNLLVPLSKTDRGTLILICGLPGAGKTTFARKLEAERNAIRMCPDDWIEAVLASQTDRQERDRLRDPVENLQWDLAKTYLAKGLTVILENGFWAEEERTQYSMEALDLNAEIELYYIEAADLDELWQRVESRNAALSNSTFVMTKGELESARAMFQPPTEGEMGFYDRSLAVHNGVLRTCRRRPLRG